MNSIDFKGSNCVLAKDQPQYLPLPVFRSHSRRGEMISCWQLTWKERLKMLWTGKMWFSLWTFAGSPQPMRPSVDNLYEELKADYEASVAAEEAGG